MKSAKKMKGAGKTKSTAVAAVIFGSLFAMSGTALTTPAAATTGPTYSVSAKSEEQLQQASAQELHEQFMALPEVQEALAAQKDDQIKISSQAFPVGMASAFGKIVLQGVLQGAGRMAFDEALRELGFDPSNAVEVSRALTDIQHSLDDLERQNTQILEAIEKVHAEVRHAKFANANDRVVAASNRISAELAVIQHWVANDVTPDQRTATRAIETLGAQITDLHGAASHFESGAVPLLLQAYDRNVSDTEQLWEATANYRDQVRVSLAQGIGGMELILENWDAPNGEYAARYDVARDSTLNTVETMYGFGVQPAGPDGQTFVQQKGGTALTETHSDIPHQDQWLWGTSDVTTSNMKSLLKGLADDYRPDNHDGMTLEEFLKSHNIATSYVYTDTWDYHLTTKKKDPTSRDTFVQPRVTLAQIVGNDYHEGPRTFGNRIFAGEERWQLISNKWDFPNTARGSRNKEIRQKAVSEVNGEVRMWKDASLGKRTGERRAEFLQRSDGAEGRVTTSKNDHNGLSGWLTDSRPESIDAAAYDTNE